MEILLFSIAVLFLIALIIFLITISKLIRKLRKEALKVRYQKIIDRALFSYLFGGQIVVDKDYNIFNFNFASNALFQKIAIKTIVALHQNYSGEYQVKLESFYRKSKLVNYSIRKLESRKWYEKVEGIRDLSNLKYQPAFEVIKASLQDNNELVQSEALIAVLKMKGITELIQQKDSILYLNDWVQSNLIFTIKTNKINHVDNLNELLDSENPSIQLLGVRLIHHFHDSAYLNQLSELGTQTNDFKLKDEIDLTIKHIIGYYQKVI